MIGRDKATRHHALDRLRATAMLLGVLYHALLFRMFIEGPPRGFMGPGGGGAARYFQDWLHSFRMPLFFLISGFFGRMMLGKYGTRRYLAKRWYRIGVPLVVGMFTFGPAYILTRDALSSMPGPGGPPETGRPGFPGGEMTPPPPGFVPPPLARFDKDGDGSLSDAEWKKARAEMAGRFGGPPPAGFGPGAQLSPGGSRARPFGPPSGGVSERLFGSSTRLYQLNHLWFLWYLLVFITAAPAVVNGLNAIVRRVSRGGADPLGRWLIRSGLAPIALGVVAGPALMLSSSPFGWSLGMPESIFRAFPDFLLHLDAVMPFYFLFFLAGWWLHREREALPALARGWFPYLLLGTLAFAAATWLSDTYARQTGLPSYGLIRWGGYTLYGIGSAATGFAFLGFFQTYLDRPSPTWRYLADTALWVYLIHQPLVIVGLYWLVPYHLPWWALAACVTPFASAAALLLYEAVVRPTFLIRLFGPAATSRLEMAASVSVQPSESPPSSPVREGDEECNDVNGGPKMLALTRKDCQAVEVWHGGELLRVIVVESRPGSVRMAFDGPESFVILREGVSKGTPVGKPADEMPPDADGLAADEEESSSRRASGGYDD